MIKTLRHPGLGAKLSLLTGFSVALLFLLFTFALSQRASQQLQSLALEDLHNQVSGVSDMAQMFDSSLSAEVESYTRLFDSFLPQPLSSDESQPQTINGLNVPLLKGGEQPLHENNTIPDDFLRRTSAISTLFVHSGEDFVRIATSLRKEDGSRAIGTVLDRTSPAWQKVSHGETYRGLALLFGKRYITQYQPVKDSAGNIIAVLFVGVDITASWQVIREKILNRRLGSSGHLYVLDGSAGKNYGNYLFHNSEEGKRPAWDDATQKQLLTATKGTLERITADGSTSIMAFSRLPGWHWTIVGEVDKPTLLNAVTTMRNQFLALGAALALAFAIFFVMIIRRWLSRPLREVINVAEHYAAGNLQVTLHTDRQDEVGQLMQAINGIGKGIEKIVMQVRQAAGDISQGTDALAADSEEMSAQINKQAGSVEETSASMEQIAATVLQNAGNISQAKQLVNSTAEAVHHGGSTVIHAVATMNNIKSASQRIADITHVIESIAFQTNILALNAAVEAARAGEHGKGFAVVAQEVRALAARSANAVKEIDGLIVDTLDKVTEGHQLSEQTRLAMESIITHIDRINLLITEINSASHEQSAGIGQVNIAMVQIGEATHINADRVSRTEQTAHDLRSKGHYLNELVSIFRLNS
ncbi:methyl-accepting chemotaxis protein [Cedecea colo]|uniref:Methyl-accepting chemotaxis protein n=1 Tax=Cedecea colo TaxID=2552946 RepID=A0ABX0VKK4_9ENTR|nr:methyl-accepting chemotaxis protein [Cedecea colo]NIY47585.1 methyl-accepting chemotaxis protein [Cedecea colo]